MRSWSLLEPRPEILLLGDEEGYEEAANNLGAVRVLDLERNDFGTPLLSGLFRSGHEHANGSVLVFLNADMILPPAFVQALAIVERRFDRFLLVGRRVDLDLDQPIDFDEGWYERLSKRAAAEGSVRGEWLHRLLCLHCDLFRDIPPFAIGPPYDNWLIWKAADEGATVVDSSQFVKVIHQNQLRAYRRPCQGLGGVEARRARGSAWPLVPLSLNLACHFHAFSLWRGAARQGRGYLLARPRRVLGHLLRPTRPLRRRVKVLLARRRSTRSES